ncbi:hypothetical protein [Lederbergia lenta]|uniref:hypothetical protein n=1 Tax=Lederbergia lenta TaxID=1467 RepID=UPI002040967C|nr:hypothetical protein [Lederbergia lenta]MCM3109947.1 hypothetical protein [Lederbergia lenta]
MGVDRSDWIVVGVDIGMKHYDDDNYEYFDQYSEQNKLGEITFLIDGMSSKYFIVGEVLSHADFYDGLGINEFPLVETNELDESAERVLEFVKMNFDMEKYPEPKLIVLTHWT